MRRTLTNALMLLVVPVTMLPIILGAGTAIDRQREEMWFQMRREHMRSVARDRRRAAERRARQKQSAAIPTDRAMLQSPP